MQLPLRPFSRCFFKTAGILKMLDNVLSCKKCLTLDSAELDFRKKNLGASWLLSFKCWLSKIFGPLGQKILLEISAVQTVNTTFSYHFSYYSYLDNFA